MLACARIGAVHSVVFGGFAANELATRIDDAKPKVILSASCGIEPGRIVKYKPLLDEAIGSPRTSPRRVSSCSARRTKRRSFPVATTTGPRCGTRPSCSRARSTTACRSPPPIRSTSSTRPARPAGPRAWCATTAATWSRSNGRCRTSTASSRARCTGPPPMSAGWWATATSSTGRCCTAARRSSTRASRSARPTPARSGA